MRYFILCFTLLFSLVLIYSCGTESTPVYTLTTSVIGEGSITPSGGEYEEGETVTLTSTPSEHWLFNNWSGDGSGSSSTVTITMDGNKNVVGNFIEKEYSINYTINGNGDVEEEVIQSKGEYTVGTMVQLTPIPTNGWRFVEWNNWDGEVDEENSIVVTVDGETNITVTFERIDYPLTITIEGEGEVEQEVIQSKRTDYPFETVVQLTSKPKDGWVFYHWSGDLSGDDNPETIEIDEGKDVTSVFKSIDELLTIDVTGEGTVDIQQESFEDNPSRRTVTLTPNPAEGWRFIEWSGTLESTDEVITVSISDEINLKVIFEEINPIRITTTSVTDIYFTSAKSGGNVTSEGNAPVTVRGVVWGTSEKPTIESNIGGTTAGSGLGSFTTNLRNLNRNTRYYVRSYAINSVGTVYGEELEFTTLNPIDNTTKVVDVTNPITGRTWMDRNLGASRAAVSSTDAQSYGDLYQWGRATDGHQITNRFDGDGKTTSGITTTRSSSDLPLHGNFILVPFQDNTFDWRRPQNDNLWQGVNGINNPCPSGYRLPTEAEWNAERQSWSSNDVAGALASPLKLPLSGFRSNVLDWISSVGSSGRYSSSAVSGANTRDMYLTSTSAFMRTRSRSFGLAVRCIKD
ncbi:MAG: hypothetical protein WDZ80_04275 [Candidatus Paceibacterota bacterium]